MHVGDFRFHALAGCRLWFQAPFVFLYYKQLTLCWIFLIDSQYFFFCFEILKAGSGVNFEHPRIRHLDLADMWDSKPRFGHSICSGMGSRYHSSFEIKSVVLPQ